MIWRENLVSRNRPWRDTLNAMIWKQEVSRKRRCALSVVPMADNEIALLDDGDVDGALTLEQLIAMAQIDEREAPKPEVTEGLQKMGEALILMDEIIDAVDDRLKTLKKDREIYARFHLPDAMKKVGLHEFGFKMEDGRQPRIINDTAMFGSLGRAEDQQAAVDWLEENGFEGGVLSSVEKKFTEEEREEAEKFAEESGGTLTRDVKAATLKAFAREALEKGKPVPFETLGLTCVPEAKITKRQ